MRELGATAIVLGLLAGLASWITPPAWELGRWAWALLAIGAALTMLHEWIQRRISA